MKWKIISKEYLLKSKWIDISKNRVQMSNSMIVDDYYVIENQDAVMIAAIDRDHNIVLKSEYRFPADQVLLELPAGAIEKKDSSILDAAKRELIEETGYTSDKWVFIGETYDCPDRCTAKLYLFIALDAEKKSVQRLDDTEEIDVTRLSIDDAVQLCISNQIKVNSCVRLIMTANHYLAMQE